MKTNRTQPDRIIAAASKRDLLAKAARTWAKSGQTDEDDILFDAALHDTGTLISDEAILEIFMSGSTDVVVVLESGTEAICIDIMHGDTVRGELE